MRIQIISVIFCFITGISSYASSRNSVEFNGSDEVIFSDKLVNSFKLLDLLQSKVSRAENFDFNDPKIQSMIHDVVLENIDLYLSVVREECDCEAVPLEQELRSLQDQIVRKFKRVLKEIVGFGQEMVWVEVQGLRRYGIIYIVITAIGEIIDHSISPIPLCKAIAFLSRGISSYVKENGLIFFGSFSDHHSIN